MDPKTPLIEYLSSQISWAQYIDFFIRIVAAGICGGVIGYERIKRSKSAGMRTHIIVCAGAAIMMIVSKYAFLDLTSVEGAMLNGTRGADPARIAAQVVSGISFIGAGVIFKNGNSVKGLTTAAGIWATAGIGLAMGAGMYAVAIFSTVAIALMQLVMHKFHFGGESTNSTVLKLTAKQGEDIHTKLFEQIGAWRGHVDEMSVESEKDGFTTYTVTVKCPAAIETEQFAEYLSREDKILSYSVSPLS